MTPFHAYYKARMLESQSDTNKIIPAYASSNIEIYPYQIATAEFALRSLYLPGVICADECSLGKTFVALLVATQKWYEGRERLLLVLPVNLVGQWIKKIQSSFTIPYVLLQSQEAFNIAEEENPFIGEGLVITTYEFAVQKCEYIKSLKWDLIIFDEADRLNKSYSEDSKTARILKEATDGSFKMLLTPTPITMDIRDIYGLIYFIDETVLSTDIDTFYKTYFRRPDRYQELAEWVSRYCFRTLKSQVEGYANFTERVPYTIACNFTEEEKALYEKLQDYIAFPEKLTYPEMKQREMSLQHNHILSSSAQAYLETVTLAIANLEKISDDKKALALYKEELNILNEVKTLAIATKINGKMKMLLNILKKCFSYLKKIGFSQKAVVYVDNLTTMEHLQMLLNEHGYSSLVFNGGNSRDFAVIEQFRNDNSTQILIATGSVTKGLDLEFCPLVINYDLLSNALELEQRISRCHRQGQLSDVLVINLFSSGNDADLRYLELINKRTLQFKGIFGLSDMTLGNFDDEIDIDEVLSKLRFPDKIKLSFKQNLLDNEQENKEIVADSTDTLFTTFTKEVAGKITITPQYVIDEIERISSELWEVVKWFFNDYNKTNDDCFFEIDEQQQTVTLTAWESSSAQAKRPAPQGPLLFYYNTGGKNKPYLSLKAYGMSKNFKPHPGCMTDQDAKRPTRYGRITLASPIGRGIINTLSCAETGTIIVDSEITPCIVGLYCVQVSLKENSAVYRTVIEERYLLVGKNESGELLNNNDCKKILELTVKDFVENGHKTQAWLKDTHVRSHELDSLVPKEEILQACFEKSTPAITEEIERLRRITAGQKSKLGYVQDDIKTKIENLNKELETMSDRINQAKIKRQISLLQKELRQRQEGLYKDSVKLDDELNQKIDELTARQNWAVTVTTHFVLQIRSCCEISVSDEAKN